MAGQKLACSRAGHTVLAALTASIFDLTGARARLPFLMASELAALLTAPPEGCSAE